jgi:hypothetical protein
VKFDKNETCYPPDILGESSTACDDEKGALKQAGCCRPDAQCGVTIDAFSLGCVALQDVPKAFGGPIGAATCKPACDDDKDCSDFSNDLICVEDKTHDAAARSCATTCGRDADCKDNVLGEQCMLFKNLADDRLDQYCGEQVGPVADGSKCGSNEDCVHGLCVRVMPTDTQGYCTRLCGGIVDCEDGQACTPISAKTPVSSTTQSVRICLGN